MLDVVDFGSVLDTVPPGVDEVVSAEAAAADPSLFSALGPAGISRAHAPASVSIPAAINPRMNLVVIFLSLLEPLAPRVVSRSPSFS